MTKPWDVKCSSSIYIYDLDSNDFILSADDLYLRYYNNQILTHSLQITKNNAHIFWIRILPDLIML